MERPYPSPEEQIDTEYQIELEGREARNLPWISREAFAQVRAEREAAVVPVPETDDLPF